MTHGSIFVSSSGIDNRMWALKPVKNPSIAKQTLKAKEMLFAIFFWHSGPLMLIVFFFFKGRGLSGSFYKNVVLKTKREQNWEKWSPASPFVTWQCASPQILNCSTVCFFNLKKPMYCCTLLTAQTWPMHLFLFSEITKKLCGRRYWSRRTLGSAFRKFLIGVPKDEDKTRFKI